MKILNSINCIHDNKVNNIAEWNLLHDTLNPSKITKHINGYYFPILHGCTNTCKGKAKSKIFEYYLVVDVVPRFWLEFW